MVEAGKSKDTKTIEGSTEAYEKLTCIQGALRKILRKKQVSFDQTIRVMFAVTRLDDTLIQIQLDEAQVH